MRYEPIGVVRRQRVKEQCAEVFHFCGLECHCAMHSREHITSQIDTHHRSISRPTSLFVWILKVKVKQSRCRPVGIQKVLGSKDSQISWQRHGMVVGCQPYVPAAFTPKKYSWYAFPLEAESTPGLQWHRKDFISMKNPLTLDGIEPATFRYVTQHLNYCATAVPCLPHGGRKKR